MKIDIVFWCFTQNFFVILLSTVQKYRGYAGTERFLIQQRQAFTGIKCDVIYGGTASVQGAKI